MAGPPIDGTRRPCTRLERGARRHRSHRHEREVRRRAGEPDKDHLARAGSAASVGSTGTGFAQPNAPNPVIVSIAGRMIEPNGSMCGIGFSVRRPARLAVSSPNHSATTPWLISCRMIARNEAGEEDETLFDLAAQVARIELSGDVDAQLMHSRAAGMASSRASAI